MKIYSILIQGVGKSCILL